MKSFNHLWEVATSEETIKKSVHKVILSRKKLHRIKKYLDEDYTASLVPYWIEHYQNDYHTPRTIYDGISRKKRTIIVPTFKELVVQHCVVEALMPVFKQGMYEHSYASIPGRGAHKGKKVIEKWIRNDSKNCKYVLKMDIKHFFDSVPHDILKERIGKYIHDERMVNLCNKIIDVSNVGLPLGFIPRNGSLIGI